MKNIGTESKDQYEILDSGLQMISAMQELSPKGKLLNFKALNEKQAQAYKLNILKVFFYFGKLTVYKFKLNIKTPKNSEEKILGLGKNSPYSKDFKGQAYRDDILFSFFQMILAMQQLLPKENALNYKELDEKDIEKYRSNIIQVFFYLGKLSFYKSLQPEIAKSTDHKITKQKPSKATLTQPITNTTKNSEVEIIHIAQRHELPEFAGSPDKDFIKDTVESQLLVAKCLTLLLQTQMMPIVVEGFYQDCDSKLYAEQKKTGFIIERLFPKGIPSKYRQLNKGQIKAIYDFTAVPILFYLGKLTFYKSIHPKISKTIDEKISKKVRGKDSETQLKVVSAISDIRESEAIDCALEAAAKFYNNKPGLKSVILIFGGEHNFSHKCAQRGIAHRRINTTQSYDNSITFNS